MNIRCLIKAKTNQCVYIGDITTLFYGVLAGR